MSRIRGFNLGGGGQGVEIYGQAASLPPSAPDGTLAFTTLEKKLWAWDQDNVLWEVIGGFGALLGRAAEESILSGSSSHTVSWAPDMPDTNYIVTATVMNNIDPNPQFLSIVALDRQLNSFTVTFNAPTDSANYTLHYYVSEYVNQI